MCNHKHSKQIKTKICNKVIHSKMQCAGQQPNQTGCWFSFPNKRQKHLMMVRPCPTFFHPQQPTSICSKNQNKDSTDNHNTQSIYIAQNKLLKTQKRAKYLGMCRLDERTKSPFFYVRPRLSDTSAKRPQVTEHRPVLWSRRERNRTRVREGVGRFCGVDGREIERESGRESAGREGVGREGF
jgi:hypothetical protein